jgi:hypothetical protein
MTTMQQPTGAMVFRSPPRHREHRRDSVLRGDELDWSESTPMDVGPTAPALREAVTMFSGVLDGIGAGVRIAVIKGFNGQMNVLGPVPWLVAPFSYIDASAESGHVDEMSDILEAFDCIRAELGLTQKEMFSATGIKKRTYHSWKRKPLGSRPRVSSQGQFWRLADALEDLRDTVDRPLDKWIRGDRQRLDALLGGRFDQLVDLAVNRPAYPKRSIGTSVYTGIAEDIDMPVIRSGKTNIEDVEDRLRP